MLRSMKRWSSSLLVLALIAVPAFAGSNDAKPANENAAKATAAEATPVAASPGLAPTAADANVTALLGVLVMKGVLAPTEANAIGNATPETKFQLLVDALNRKGLLTAADLSAATSAPAQPSAPVSAPAAVTQPVAVSFANPDPAPAPQAAAAPPMPPPPAVIPAVAPLRVLPVDAPKTGGLNGIKVGAITLAPYGFIKATAIQDSSDPNGDDFPFPGIFLTTTSSLSTGPTLAPAFHVKARSTRFGLNLEWPDMSKKLTLTGKIEADFEGNFSEVDNRDVSSIRSNEPQIRLAFVRMDYHASEATDIFFVGGQDWTLFGSGALPNILETTFLGAFWGDIYERSPQLRGGFIQTLNKEHNVKFEPQFGIMMPSSGQILKLGTAVGAPGFEGQIGEGEDEGAQSDRPEWEGRAALSFQLDPAKGVAPAQIALSGFWAKRTSIITNASAQATLGELCTEAASPYATYCNQGFTDSSNLYGTQLTLQLPTRWFTLVGSAYRGGDLRFYFGGQINSYVTDTTGLTNIQGAFVTTDGGPMVAAGNAYLGTNASGQVVVAPQKPVRSFGGFINLGLPLSRWFNANPTGHNAGWQLYFDLGKDQVSNRDLNNPNFIGIAAPLPLAMGKMAAVTLYYKLNPWCQFAFEQSVYATRIKDGLTLYEIAGQPSNEWQDHRTEFGPIFTF
jgi:hypothetical protein